MRVNRPKTDGCPRCAVATGSASSYGEFLLQDFRNKREWIFSLVRRKSAMLEVGVTLRRHGGIVVGKPEHLLSSSCDDLPTAKSHVGEAMLVNGDLLFREALREVRNALEVVC